MVMLELFNFLHFVGLAFGLGGATIAFIISKKSEKNPNIARAAMEINLTISKLIWLGLLLLIISGIFISFYVKWPINKQILIIKHSLVVLIVIFGIIIGRIVRKMSKLALNQEPTKEFLKIKNQLKFFTSLNLVLWYIITLLSVFV